MVMLMFVVVMVFMVMFALALAAYPDIGVHADDAAFGGRLQIDTSTYQNDMTTFKLAGNGNACLYFKRRSAET